MTIDPDFLDRYDDDDSDEGIVCKHCGQGGLDWFSTGVRWRLIDEEGNFHTCRPVASADDFDVAD